MDSFGGHDRDLHGDILLMHAVDEQGAEHRVDRGVNRGLRVEKEQAERIEHGVEEEGELSHREARALFREVQPENVHAAARAAAGEHQAA